MCIDIVEIYFGIAYWQVSSVFDTIMAGYYCFMFYFIILFVSDPIVHLFVFHLTFEKLIETQTLSFARKILLSLFAYHYENTPIQIY